LVTERQKEVIHALGKFNENKNVAHDRLGIVQSTVRSTCTSVFVNFVETLELMDEYFPVFQRRFSYKPELYTQLRRLSRKIRGEQT
jgi:hypothetical protein